MGRKLRDAAYQPMIELVLHDANPHFAFLEYASSTWTVRNLVLVPKHFITPAVIEKCGPLGSAARRAGWVGCNILLDMIPSEGRIHAVRNGTPLPPGTVRSRWARFAWLASVSPDVRGGTADVLRCARRLGQIFNLAEVYAFEHELAAAHPDNRHVRDKIRQQLQILRDRGIVQFLGCGKYRAV